MLTGLWRLAGTQLRAFQISLLQTSKALKLKTVLPVKTQVSPPPFSFLSVNLTILGMSGSWNHAEFVLLRLTDLHLA